MRTKTVRIDKTKPAIPKEGIFIRENSKGFYATLKENKFKLAMLGGYNRKQGVHKGLYAVYMALSKAYRGSGHFEVIDLSGPKSKSTTKKKK